MAYYASNKQIGDLDVLGGTITSTSLIPCQTVALEKLGTVTPADIIGAVTLDDIGEGTTYERMTAIEHANYTAHIADETNPHAVNKADIGLSAVENYSALGLPISTATQAAITSHISETSNPHGVEADEIPIIDSGDIIIAVNVETALQEIKTAVDAVVSTDLSVGTVNSSTVSITSDGGADDVTLPAATGSLAGLLSATTQTVGGVKTFSSFPVTPSAVPTTDYQAANKKYSDDLIVTNTLGSYDMTGDSTQAIDFSTNDTVVVYDLDTGCTLTLTDIPIGKTVMLILEATSVNVNWAVSPAGGIYWPAGTAPSLSDSGYNIIPITHFQNDASAHIYLAGYTTGMETV